MSIYRHIRNAVVDETGKQVLLVMPVSGTRKQAVAAAAYCAQQLNHDARDKARRAEAKKEARNA